MPSLPHEFLIELFRTNPQLLLSLMPTPQPPIPTFSRVCWLEGGLTDLPTEFRADLVLVFYLGDQPVWAVILEVQLRRKDDKRRVWPGYVGVARARHGCPASLVVITLDDDVKAWAAQPIADEVPGGLSLRPVALGPADFPPLTPLTAARCPELAMVAVMSSAKKPDLLQVAETALRGMDGLSDQTRKLYYDVIQALIRKAFDDGLLEKQMLTEFREKFRHEFQSLFDEGKAEGKTEGQLESRAEDLLEALQLRGLAVSPEQALRIRSCQNPALLKRWFVRSFTASNTADVFAD